MLLNFAILQMHGCTILLSGTLLTLLTLPVPLSPNTNSKRIDINYQMIKINLPLIQKEPLLQNRTSYTIMKISVKSGSLIQRLNHQEVLTLSILSILSILTLSRSSASKLVSTSKNQLIVPLRCLTQTTIHQHQKI